jgi:glycosyltransferase involved in cell wall biosynthesis
LRRLTTAHDLDVTVVAPRPGPLAAGLAEMGIDVHLTRPYEVHPDHYEGAVSELQALLNDIAPDIVLANTLGVFPAVDAALRQGRAVVWAIHESFEIEDFIYLNWGSRNLHDAVEERMRVALTGAHTIFEAEPTLDLYLRQVPDLKGRHIHYGIDVGVIERFRQTHDRWALRAERGIAEDETILLCMGVFQERKAQLALVLAFATVAPLFPRARLVLVGEHPTAYASSLREAVRQLGLEDRVEFVPIQPDIYPWYSVADILVNASDVESLPRSILEAKAFGLPTLATDVFGLSEIISDGVNGWLCRAHSGNALATGLHRALTTRPEVLEAMRENCRNEAPRFDGAGYAEAYHQLFTQLVQTRATQPTSGATA